MLNNSKFNVIMTTITLIRKFIACCFIWFPQGGSHLGHLVRAPLLWNRYHCFLPTSQFLLSNGEELRYDQAHFYQQRKEEQYTQISFHQFRCWRFLPLATGFTDIRPLTVLYLQQRNLVFSPPVPKFFNTLLNNLRSFFGIQIWWTKLTRWWND